MYEEHFGLSKRPFLAEPDPSRYFPAPVVENARQALARTIRHGQGAGLVVGPPGTGKSILCQVLAEQFRERFAVVVLPGCRLSKPRALLKAILHQLGLPFHGLEEEELRLTLVDFLCHSEQRPEAMLLIIDEAHGLSGRVLDEVRLMMTWSSDGMPVCRTVLAGNGQLEEKLTDPRLEALNQRIVTRCYLEAFDRQTTADYIGAMIQQAGGDPDRLFPTEARIAVYQATDGIPRLVNQLCDHALFLAFTNATEVVDAALVQEAWADLQQLPAPWNQKLESQEGGSSIVEFGQLDDDEETTGNSYAAGEAASDPGRTETSPAEDHSSPSLNLSPTDRHTEQPAEQPQQKPKQQPEEKAELAVAVIDKERGTEQVCEMPQERQELFGQVENHLEQIDRGLAESISQTTKKEPSLDPFAEPFDQEEEVVDVVTIPVDQPAAEQLRSMPSAMPRSDSAHQGSVGDMIVVECVPEVALTSAEQSFTPVEAAWYGYDFALQHGLEPQLAASPIDCQYNQTSTLSDETKEPPKPVSIIAEEGKQHGGPQAVTIPLRQAEEVPAGQSVLSPFRIRVDLPEQEQDESYLAVLEDDRDIISVEEEPIETVRHPKTAVYRQEYRRLFSRLRHGR